MDKIRIINLSKVKESNNLRQIPGWLEIPEIKADVQEYEKLAFCRTVNQELSDVKKEGITTPPKSYFSEKNVLAIHWHPEFIPLDLISKRIENTFPNAENSLIIPTQHNVIMKMDGYSGVEVDCYSGEFSRKVQLLIHFGSFDETRAKKFLSMIEHTFKYRSKQLYDLLDALSSNPDNKKISQAIQTTGASEEIVRFVKTNTGKLLQMVDGSSSEISPLVLKNKIARDYFDELRQHFDNRIIDKAQVFIKAVKEIVKKDFDSGYFYRTTDIIEEARFLGACIVIPHPEQFWPVLLAEYDVDGYEVWNPQSREYTEFLIHVLFKQNKSKKSKKRPLLVFMGDDTHMGEKAREITIQDAEKAGREIGVQTAWDDPDIQKILIEAGFSKESIIKEYKSRLGAPAKEGEESG